MKKKMLAAAVNLAAFTSDNAHLAMAPLSRPVRPMIPADAREGAVLLLFYQMEETTSLLFIKRRDDLKHHPGQVAFPGGRREPGESLQETALRETEEEVGIKPTQVQLLGTLAPLYIPPSNFHVTPYVGWAAARQEYILQESEVERVLEIPLPTLLQPAVRKTEFWSMRGEQRKVPFFDIPPFKIWGATAMMLSEMLARIDHVLPTKEG